MNQPSKETLLAWRRTMITAQTREIIAWMRANPPTIQMDPSLHVYCHSSGERVGWEKAMNMLERLAEEDTSSSRVSRDTID